MGGLPRPLGAEVGVCLITCEVGVPTGIMLASFTALMLTTPVAVEVILTEGEGVLIGLEVAAEVSSIKD